MITKERNPHLPEAPADGLHSFHGPADLGGNSRCTFCGAYQGSVEGDAPCRGEYKESGRMRSWAAEQWAIDRLSEGGPMREIVSLVQRTTAPHKHEGALYTHTPVKALILNCGHERTVDSSEYSTVEGGGTFQVACYVCEMRIEDRDIW